MPRLTFRLKLLLAFLLVIVGAVGASLVVIDRRFRHDLDEREAEARYRILQACETAQRVQVDQLVWGCQVVAGQPRFRAIIESGSWDDPLTRDTLAEVASESWRDLRVPFLCFIGGKIGQPKSMKSVSVSVEGEPQDWPDAAAAAEGLAMEAFVRLEQHRGEQVSTGYLLHGDTLFRLVAFPLQERVEVNPDSPLVGAVVVGTRLSKTDLLDIGQVVDSQSSVAVAVGDRLVLSAGEPWSPEGSIGDLLARVMKSGGVELPGNDPCIVSAAALAGVRAGGGEQQGAILVRISTAREHQRLAETSKMILAVGGLSIAVAGLIALLLSGSISKPILDLVEGSRRIGKGDYSVELAVRSRDELGTLTAAFNDMAKGLADRERYRSVLTKVVSKEVAQELMSQMRGQGLDFEGVGRTCTALFCDIRGFTPLTERMEPRDVISLLNEHMSAMVRVVERHKGVVNKFVGDAIIGIFGAPVAHERDPLHAVRAGLDMIAEVRRINVGRVAKGLKEVAIGVGIHTGPMVCGVMGSQERAEYTVLGAAVNLTSRVCGGAKAMQVLMSGATYECVKDAVEAAPLGGQTYKGFSEPVQVFEVRSLRGGQNESSPAVDAGARV